MNPRTHRNLQAPGFLRPATSDLRAAARKLRDGGKRKVGEVWIPRHKINVVLMARNERVTSVAGWPLVSLSCVSSFFSHLPQLLQQAPSC